MGSGGPEPLAVELTGEFGTGTEFGPGDECRSGLEAAFPDSAGTDGMTRASVQRRLEGPRPRESVHHRGRLPGRRRGDPRRERRGAPPAALSYNPFLILFGTLVMRSPLVVALFPEIDRRALALLGVLTAYTYAIEIVGVRTGWPYGTFEYGIRLGPMVGGEVPPALPLFFVPLVLNAFLLAILALGERAVRVVPRVLAAIAAVLAIDLVLDPAAVAIGFWTYVPPGTTTAFRPRTTAAGSSRAVAVVPSISRSIARPCSSASVPANRAGRSGEFPRAMGNDQRALRPVAARRRRRPVLSRAPPDRSLRPRDGSGGAPGGQRPTVVPCIDRER